MGTLACKQCGRPIVGLATTYEWIADSTHELGGWTEVAVAGDGYPDPKGRSNVFHLPECPEMLAAREDRTLDFLQGLR